MSEYFSKPRPLERNVKVELDWSSYTTKTDFKNARGAGLATLNSEIDKLQFGKLETATVDLSKLSDVAKIRFLKRLHKMN